MRMAFPECLEILHRKQIAFDIGIGRDPGGAWGVVVYRDSTLIIQRFAATNG